MTHTNLSDRYDAAAPRWTGKLSRMGYPAAYKSFVDWALPNSVLRNSVCDVGTGCGAFADGYLRSQGAPGTLCLVDTSSRMLSEAKKSLSGRIQGLTYIQCSVETFEPDYPFDLVLAAHVIEHCSDPTFALKKLWKSVAPGGSLLLIASRPHWCQWLIWLRWRHRWFSQAAVRDMAAKHRLPQPAVFSFALGPPSRTSLGYVFHKPNLP